jgi:hypothetical protein
MNRTVKRREKTGEVVAYSESGIRHNHILIEYCRTSMAALGGCTAGILGLTSLYGFAFYVITSLLLWIMILAKAGPSWNKYFRERSPLLIGTLTGGIGTYILFWTFIYGMVHVY